jgi:serine/threonine protein kinase
MADFPGIPGCRIISVLGEGGVSTVYLGIQEKLDRKVAIKVLKAKFLTDELTVQRFEKDAKAAASLQHSNIVQIFDTGKANDYYYIVMEYLDETLKDRMKLSPEGKMHPGIALDIVEGIMKALDYAHFRGVYHRDIKPDNIMFKQDSTPALVDFGIARVLDSPVTLKTTPGTTLGTVYYMSPEQARGQQDVDGRSDIYSLGAILFEMLTGKRPYEGDSYVTVSLKQIEDPVPKLPQELSRYQPLIDKMMAKDREKRISSGAQFVQILDRILTNPVDYTSQPSLPLPQSMDPTLSPLRKTSPDSLKRQKRRAITQLFRRCWHFIRVKINLSDKKKYTPQEKIRIAILVGFPSVVLLGIIFIFIFNPGPGKSNRELDTKMDQSFTIFSPGELFKQISKFLQAHDLYKKNDLESLERAQVLTSELIMIINTPEVKELEMKISDRILELRKKFNEYLETADKYYFEKNPSEAKKYVLLAKRIKITDGLLELEKLIEEKIKILKR